MGLTTEYLDQIYSPLGDLTSCVKKLFVAFAARIAHTIFMEYFERADRSLFFSRGDNQDPRLGELTACQTDPAKLAPGTAVIGYPDDTGIRLNGGRVGAKDAPHAIRRWLYRMTPHPERQLPKIYDFGDLIVRGSLEERHQTVEAMQSSLLAAGHRVLSFGGGHDYAYPDVAAFLKWCESKKQRALVINFDAHLDVRDLDRGLTSGTPFFRMLEQFHNVDFFEIGVQSQCNSKAHWNYCKEKGTRILALEEFLISGKSFVEWSTAHLAETLLRSRPTFLSIDIDGFFLPSAPGASQSWPTGIEPNAFFPLLEVLLQRLDVRGLGIYEVSPPLDSANATAKLAALIAHRFIHAK